MRTSSWGLVVALLLIGSPLLAQVGEPYDDPELLQKSDLVAIAECQDVYDTGGRLPDAELGYRAYPVQEWRASFRVTVVLKAHATTGVGSTIALRFFRFDSGKWEEQHPGAGIVLSLPSVVLKPGESHLLFLKARAFGVYDPATGHVSPNDSVHLLDRPPESDK